MTVRQARVNYPLADDFVTRDDPTEALFQSHVAGALDELGALRGRIDKAVTLANDFGWYDGAHHKQWVLDQMVRALLSEGEYAAWVDEGGWDEGTPP